MRFHAIHAPHWMKDRISGLLYDLFHGMARRDGMQCPFYDSYSYSGDPTNPVTIRRVQRTPSGVRGVEMCGHDKQVLHPLDIQRSGWRVPDVTCPIGELVVSERVKNALEGLPNIDFLRVRFTKLIRYEFRIGDCPWPEMEEIEDGDRVAEDFFASMPNVLEYHRSIGPHYEALIPSRIYLKEKYPQAEYRCVIGEPNDKHADGIVSPQMLEENAIVDAGSGYFMSDRTFSILEPYVDWDFFEHKEASI